MHPTRHPFIKDHSNSFLDFLTDMKDALIYGAADATINLENNENFFYIGDIYVGSQKKQLSLIFDTGSAWLVVEAASCTNCVSTTFDNTQSTTFTKTSTSNSLNLAYGSANIYGFTGTDTVGFDSNLNKKVTGFEFFLVRSQTGINSEFDGIAGMSRDISSTSFSNGPKFLAELYDQGQISSKSFAFYLSNDGTTQSTVELGGYSSSMIRSGESITYINLVSNFFWCQYATGFRVGTGDFLADGKTISAYSTAQTQAIFDTGTTLLYTPSGYASQIQSLLIKGKSQATISKGYAFVPCSGTYESFFLYIEGHYFEVTPESYIFPNDDTNTQCVFGIVDGGSEYWLLGDVFLKNYYTIWDDTNSKLGFAPHIHSDSTIVTGTAPTEKFSPNAFTVTALIKYIIQAVLYSVASWAIKTYILPCLGIEASFKGGIHHTKKKEMNLEQSFRTENKSDMIIIVVPEPNINYAKI